MIGTGRGVTWLLVAWLLANADVASPSFGLLAADAERVRDMLEGGRLGTAGVIA